MSRTHDDVWAVGEERAIAEYEYRASADMYVFQLEATALSSITEVVQHCTAVWPSTGAEVSGTCCSRRSDGLRLKVDMRRHVIRSRLHFVEAMEVALDDCREVLACDCMRRRRLTMPRPEGCEGWTLSCSYDVDRGTDEDGYATCSVELEATGNDVSPRLSLETALMRFTGQPLARETEAIPRPLLGHLHVSLASSPEWVCSYKVDGEHAMMWLDETGLVFFKTRSVGRWTLDSELSDASGTWRGLRSPGTLMEVELLPRCIVALSSLWPFLGIGTACFTSGTTPLQPPAWLLSKTYGQLDGFDQSHGTHVIDDSGTEAPCDGVVACRRGSPLDVYKVGQPGINAFVAMPPCSCRLKASLLLREWGPLPPSYLDAPEGRPPPPLHGVVECQPGGITRDRLSEEADSLATAISIVSSSASFFEVALSELCSRLWGTSDAACDWLCEADTYDVSVMPASLAEAASKTDGKFKVVLYADRAEEMDLAWLAYARAGRSLHRGCSCDHSDEQGPWLVRTTDDPSHLLVGLRVYFVSVLPRRSSEAFAAAVESVSRSCRRAYVHALATDTVSLTVPVSQRVRSMPHAAQLTLTRQADTQSVRVALLGAMCAGEAIVSAVVPSTVSAVHAGEAASLRRSLRACPPAGLTLYQGVWAP